MIEPKSILQATKGRFTKVAYTNMKGETKKYTIRLGVRKYLSFSTEKPYQKTTPEGAVKVYSVTKGNTGYKTFYLDQIQSIQCGSLTFVRVW
jgi:hypothetical protein